jgi:acyl-CoA synthetase (AMP-forming)/AMP-acid ligase II
MVAHHARLRPQQIGAADSRRQLTYAQWSDRASGLASALLAQGLKPGERVAILAYNRIEWLEIYVALARAGLVALPLNFRLVSTEIAYILKDAQVSALVCAQSLQDKAPNPNELPDVRLRIQMDGEQSNGWLNYESLIQNASRAVAWPHVDIKSICALMYTSGTTGKPKGAVRSHEASTLMAYATAMEMGFTRNDKALLVMPLCHANSLYFANTFIHLAACIIIDDNASFDPKNLLMLLSKHEITFTSLVPTHYTLLLALPEDVKQQFAPRSVARLLVSSAPANASLKNAILGLFPNGQLYELYGSTEAGWVTLLRPEDQLTKLGSVGREWAGSGPIKLLDMQRQEVADGETGELFSCTSYAFEGYWGAPEKTAEAFAHEWCSVGDMAMRDADGYIWLKDRKSNMIISGGENIYPSEVEGVLCSHPAVQEAAAIGVTDEKWGETVVAVVVLKSGAECNEDELKQWCKSRLAGYKQPRHYVYKCSDDLPRTATGKVMHRRLREVIQLPTNELSMT